MKKEVSHFRKHDPIMEKLVITWLESDEPKPKKLKPTDYVMELYSSIISQQISAKAAATIKNRFFELIKNDDTPDRILKISDESLRKVGISRQKANYIRSIAENELTNNVNFELFDSLSDEEIIEQLTKIKGVGRWTAEMFLIFTLARANVFSSGDLGLNNAIIKNYKLKSLSQNKIIRLSDKWSPYKSTASLALWYSLDNKKISY